ncbi:MAG: DUF2085 domain-containing protein [Rhodothermales bacterium]
MTHEQAPWEAGWGAAVACTAALVVLIFAPSFAGGDVRSLVMAAFSGVCHQMPSRSPHVGGIQLAVCDRCLGIYLALAAAATIYPLARFVDDPLGRHAGLAILIGVLVPGADWVVDVLGLWSNTPASRLMTGAVFGVVAGYYFTGGLVGLIDGNRDGREET